MERPEFEQLALEHLDAVYRVALTLARHPDEASDLVQETYLRALRAADGFVEKGGGMRSWLFTILHNAFYTKIKKDARAPIAVEEFHQPDDRSPAPDEPPPAWDLQSLDWEYVDGTIINAINDLSTEYRETLLLWAVEGLKYRDIAQILDVPIGTIMSRLHRARRILSKELEDFAAENGWHPGKAKARADAPD